MTCVFFISFPLTIIAYSLFQIFDGLGSIYSIRGEILTGETPSVKRAQAVENFQQGLSPVFVGTFGAGGVGLTLTAACTIILVDRPWTPGDAMQAEDRVRRIGQTKKVTSIWMTAFEVDEQIFEQKKI